MVVTVKILFFASAREAAGNVSKTSVELTTDEANTQSLRIKLATMYPNMADMVRDEDNLTFALNEEYLTRGEILPLKDGDTVALIPPISGG